MENNTLNNEIEKLLSYKKEYNDPKFDNEIFKLKRKIDDFNFRKNDFVEFDEVLAASKGKILETYNVGYDMPKRYKGLKIIGIMFLILAVIAFLSYYVYPPIGFGSTIIMGICIIVGLVTLITYMYLRENRVNYDEIVKKTALELNGYFPLLRNKKVKKFNSLAEEFKFGDILVFEVDYNLKWIVEAEDCLLYMELTESGHSKISKIENKYIRYIDDIKFEIFEINEQKEYIKLLYKSFLNRCKFITSPYPKFDDDLLENLYPIHKSNPNLSWEELNSEYQYRMKKKKEALEEKERKQKLEDEVRRQREKERLNDLYNKYKDEACDDANASIFKELANHGYKEAMAEYGWYLIAYNISSSNGLSYLQKAANKGYLYAYTYMIDIVHRTYEDNPYDIVYYGNKYVSDALKLEKGMVCKWRYAFSRKIIGVQLVFDALVNKSLSKCQKGRDLLIEAKNNGSDIGNFLAIANDAISELGGKVSYSSNSNSIKNEPQYMKVTEIYLSKTGDKLYYKNNKVFDIQGRIYFYIRNDMIFNGNDTYVGDIRSNDVYSSSGELIYSGPSMSSPYIKNSNGDIVAYIGEATMPYKNI